MGKLIPCREPLPSLPKKRNKKKIDTPYENHELFGFDTETTRCGKKELRSYQAVYDDEEGNRYGILIYLNDWYAVNRLQALDISLRNKVDNYVGTLVVRCESLAELRRKCQQAHEMLLYNDQPRTIRNKNNRWQRSRRKVLRCACAFNGNFDYGAMANYTQLGELEMGTMSGAGVRYVFSAGDDNDENAYRGLRIEALYLGAMSVPFVGKRGELWDVQPCASSLWGTKGLKGCGEKVGIPKEDPDFNCPVYAMIDAVVTLETAQQLTRDLKEMGFSGMPDRFISGATVSKDVLQRHYEPFYLTKEQHEFVWPAYFGGMTGPTKPDYSHESVSDVVYGDLDGAYNASGQNLEVFDWDGAREVTAQECRKIVRKVRDNPALFWQYGSLHLHVKGTFGRCPIRVASVGCNNDVNNPSSSKGLVWAKMKNYETTLALGDFLFSEPESNVKILGGLMATKEEGRGPCIFKMAAEERKKFKSGTVGNTWWKLVGNAVYGVLANRNGKTRQESGPFFNGLMASSITSAIRYCLWIVNEAAGEECYYNDTDSAMTTVEGFVRAKKALEPLNIGFSNKTDDELKNCDVAIMAIIHGSKRYCMVSKDGDFGAKCHGLGSWWCYYKGKVRSLAHDKKLLRAVWTIGYPDHLGDVDREIAELKVFHKFSVRTQKISHLTIRYAMRQFGIPLRKTGSYGRAGNFGFLCPKLVDGKVTPHVAYDPEEAIALSDMTLEDVAMIWSSSFDSKYDYTTFDRWTWGGDEIRLVEAVPHTQQLMASELEGDISVVEMGEYE